MPEEPTPRLIGARHAGGFRVALSFEDGTEAVIDLEDQLFGEVFEPLRDREAFKALRFDPELGTIVWPTGADLAPEFLYERARS